MSHSKTNQKATGAPLLRGLPVSLSLATQRGRPSLSLSLFGRITGAPQSQGLFSLILLYRRTVKSLQNDVQNKLKKSSSGGAAQKGTKKVILHISIKIAPKTRKNVGVGGPPVAPLLKAQKLGAPLLGGPPVAKIRNGTLNFIYFGKNVAPPLCLIFTRRLRCQCSSKISFVAVQLIGRA